MSLATAPPDTQALEARSTDLGARLEALKIENYREVAPDVLRRSLEESVVVRNLADDFLKEVDASVGPTVDAAFKAHRTAVALRDGLKKPAEALKRTAGELGWHCDQELKRRQVEAERVQRAEQERLQHEADEQAERERVAAQRAVEDARLIQAVDLEARGDHEAAAKLIEQPVTVETPRAAPAFMPPAPEVAVKVEGASFGTDWGFTIYEALLPEAYWLRIPNEKMIAAVVKTMKDKTAIPGVTVFPKPRPSRR